MPITGSQKALMQARSGIARAGATRAGYYFPNVVLTINGVDRSAALVAGSLRIREAINDQPDTATFQLKPGTTIPAVGELVNIGLGTGANLEFAGQVVRSSRTRRQGLFEFPFIDVECYDWMRLFNRRLITHTFDNETVTAIALAILVTYTDGFTGYGVQTGLPTLDSFVCINETPGSAMRRLVGLIGGGGFVITPDRDVRLFDANGDLMPGAGTNPQSLTNTLGTLKAYTAIRDGRQQRNRIIAEGRSQRVMIDVPVGEGNIPLEVGWGFVPAGGYVRIGSEVFPYAAVTQLTGPPSCVVTADANPGDTTIAVDNAGPMSVLTGVGWAHTSGGSLFFHVTIGGTTQLFDIPASGYGSILETIPAGTPLYAQDGIELSNPFVTTRAITAGTMATYVVIDDDAAEQTALAVVEGGDGIHEHFVAVPNEAEYYGVAAIAEAELDAFADADGLLEIEWTTMDLNAKPGRAQAIAITGTDALTATVTINSVDLEFPVAGQPPFRHCRAGTVNLPRLADLLDFVTRV